MTPSVIARSPCDEAIQGPRAVAPGLLRCARNDDGVDAAIIGHRLSGLRARKWTTESKFTNSNESSHRFAGFDRTCYSLTAPNAVFGSAVSMFRGPSCTPHMMLCRVAESRSRL